MPSESQPMKDTCRKAARETGFMANQVRHQYYWDADDDLRRNPVYGGDVKIQGEKSLSRWAGNVESKRKGVRKWPSSHDHKVSQRRN